VSLKKMGKGVRSSSMTTDLGNPEKFFTKNREIGGKKILKTRKNFL
jgi:hypothetical protein